MPKKEYTKEEKRKKRLQHEFGDNLSYSNKNDMDDYFKGLDEYEYNKVPYFVQTGPAIASKAPSFYLDQEYAFPRMGFYTFMPGDNITKDVEYLKDYSGIPAIYYWNEGTGLFNSTHKPEAAVPGDENYPKLIDNWVDLSNMAGVPAYVGESPQVSKQLPNLVVTPQQKYFIIRQKNGGIMKKLINKYLLGRIIGTYDKGNADNRNKLEQAAETLMKTSFPLLSYVKDKIQKKPQKQKEEPMVENSVILPELVVTAKKPKSTRQQRFNLTFRRAMFPLVDLFYKKEGGMLIPKHQLGKPIEKSDNFDISIKSPKRNLDREMYYYYNNLINNAFPVTFEDFKLKLINTGVLPIQDEYSVPVGHLGDGYRSVVVSPEILYGPYDLPLLTINGWGRTLDPEYSDEEQWKDIARKTIQNDSTLSLSDATKYMWALDHPEFKLHPMFRSMATPIQPGPWDRMLYTSGEYKGYLPSDNPKYGGDGTMSYGWDYPTRSTTYKTTKYPPEDWHNKEHLYNWLDKFYNRKNGINK